MNLYLPDTHAVYWHEFRIPKLSTIAEQAFRDAEVGNAELLIHPIVLAEFYWLLKKAGLEADFPRYVQYVDRSPIYHYEPIVMNDELERYLDRACRGIAGPRALREHVRRELREHLLDAAAEHRAHGISAELALAKAIEAQDRGRLAEAVRQFEEAAGAVGGPAGPTTRPG